MNKENRKNVLFLTNKTVNTGAYIIIFSLQNDIEIVIGKTKTNKKLFFKKGCYVYIGSAMGKKGSTTLQNRVFRHTKREKEKSHTIQNELLNELRKRDLTPTNIKTRKKLKWNIDYLLENENTIIEKILLIPCEEKIEEIISKKLNENTSFKITHKGFGSSDLKNTKTNLLYASEKKIASITIKEVKAILKENKC